MARGFNYAPGASVELQEAMRPELGRATLMVMGASRNSLVRAAIAARPDCPLGLMVTLAHDYHADVRAAIARNPAAQRTVMAYLSADRHVEVLKALLENPSLPAELLEEMAFHKKSEVRMAAALRLDEGMAAAEEPPVEDTHTPELAEHVMPFTSQMTADGSVVPTLEPVNVVDIATGEPIAVAAPSTPAIPQIFTPHSTPDAPAPTRTAPVRGFKVRQ